MRPISCHIGAMADDTIEDDEDTSLTMVDEALVAGNITNSPLVLAMFPATSASSTMVSCRSSSSSIVSSMASMWQLLTCLQAMPAPPSAPPSR